MGSTGSTTASATATESPSAEVSEESEALKEYLRLSSEHLRSKNKLIKTVTWILRIAAVLIGGFFIAVVLFILFNMLIMSL